MGPQVIDNNLFICFHLEAVDLWDVICLWLFFSGFRYPLWSFPPIRHLNCDSAGALLDSSRAKPIAVSGNSLQVPSLTTFFYLKSTGNKQTTYFLLNYHTKREAGCQQKANESSGHLRHTVVTRKQLICQTLYLLSLWKVLICKCDVDVWKELLNTFSGWQ